MIAPRVLFWIALTGAAILGGTLSLLFEQKVHRFYVVDISPNKKGVSCETPFC